MSKLHQLTQVGQAIWYDYIRRAFITSGELQGLIESGVRGVTSNPTIIAKTYRFRATFFNDPNIGGRYSALSHFGLVPAALIGVDTALLLDRAAIMASNCESCNCPVEGNNSGAQLGAVMGELAVAGRDKVTLIASPSIAAFGPWVEQLIAESTGKEGRGILPVADEPPESPNVYGATVLPFIRAGKPVVQIQLHDLYDLGGEFFRWEMVTSLAGRRIGINPFDQPNVETAKVLARQMVAAYQKDGVLPTLTPTLQADGFTVYADMQAATLKGIVNTFLAEARPGDYIALQVYVQPTQQTSAALQRLRTQLRDTLRLATKVGYGPRFLHSTGLLHKGDAGNGLFIQFTDDNAQDIPIPETAGSNGSSITFGVLKMAQSLGDRQALLDAHRRVIHFHLEKDVIGGLEKLTKALA